MCDVFHETMRSSVPSIPARVYCPRCSCSYEGHRAFCPIDGARLSEEPANSIDQAVDPSPTAIGSTLVAGRYDIEQLIGQGSMARVYRAVDRVTGEQVALKLLARNYAEKERECKRFFHEARAVLCIDHPNVVKVLDVGRRADGRPFIVIEYLRGESLGECLRRRGALPLRESIRILHLAALGLSAVHRAGIVHRDVKPDNIFLLGPIDAPTGVRLVDFGLAKLHGNKPGGEQRRWTMGTAAYMPPEQVLSEKVDARADVYSLGVVLFRCITGHLPFEGPNDLDMLAHQVLQQAPPPSWLVDELDPRVDAVVARATRKCPCNRYPDMDSLAHDLDRLQTSGPLLDDTLVTVDRYTPTSPLGRDVAVLFCNRLGIDAPWKSMGQSTGQTMENHREP